MVARLIMTLPAGLVGAAVAADSLEERSLTALENQVAEIDGQLGRLANYNPTGGVGAIGSRSRAYDTADREEWIEIDLGDPVPLDQVVVVPAIRRDGINGFQADGFPLAFRVRLGTGDDREGKIVAEFSSRDGLLPRIAPVVIPCHGTTATWIRLEATVLSRREFDAKFVLQFAEILAFSGEENAALHRPVRFRGGRDRASAPGWPESGVVDGFLPYLMATAAGPKSVAFLSTTELSDQPALTVDLGARHPLSRLHLHAVDQSDTVPQTHAGDLGIPQVLRVEGADAADFSDARLLLESRYESLYDVGPILIAKFPAVTCRYVRFVAVKLNRDAPFRAGLPRLGFAEIELFAQGRNVALHQPVTANFSTDDPVRLLSNLTDGRNFYGPILPIRTWLNQLSLRHELERQRPLILAELNRRYAEQKANVTRLTGLATVLAFGVVVIVLMNRSRQQRAIEETRKRIAADLHDELGADLHAIGLLSDLALAARAAPDRLEDLLQRMRSLTERTGKAARHCTNLLEAGDLHGDLVDDMRRASTRILADLNHDVVVDGEAGLLELSPRKRIDLLLFYQESLINIIRHSGASRVRTHLTAANGKITLTVTDDGRGLDGRVPASLKRRARLLGAEVEAGRSEENGARIVLHLKRRRFGFLP
jgi:signal transduction histidine kinase